MNKLLSVICTFVLISQLNFKITPSKKQPKVLLGNTIVYRAIHAKLIHVFVDDYFVPGSMLCSKTVVYKQTWFLTSWNMQSI